MNNHIKISLALLSVPLCQAAAKENKNDRPNIVIIYCDDMGYGDIGVTGHPDIKTPNLDRMALDGMRFTNYYSASPASTASRYSLLTGRYRSCRFPVGLESGCGERYSSPGIDNSRTSEGTRLCYGYLW